MIGYTYLFPKFCFDKFECSPLIPSQVEVVVVVCGVDRNPWRAPVPLPGHCEKPTDLQVWEASGGMEASRRYEWDMFIGKHIAQRARNLSWKPSIILGFRDITATPPHIPSDKLIFFRGVGFHPPSSYFAYRIEQYSWSTHTNPYNVGPPNVMFVGLDSHQ